MIRLGIIGSGEGSNMMAIADACDSRMLHAKVSIVISDVEDAKIIQFARCRNIDSRFIVPGPFQKKLSQKAEYDFILTLRNASVDWVILAGFCRIISANFIRSFPHKIINIHPSLLPSFPGLNAPQQALLHGVKITGSTVHFVDEGIDTGKIIDQVSVKVHDEDTPQILHKRIKKAEHKLYPKVISDLISGRIQDHNEIYDSHDSHDSHNQIHDSDSDFDPNSNSQL